MMHKQLKDINHSAIMTRKMQTDCFKASHFSIVGEEERDKVCEGLTNFQYRRKLSCNCQVIEIR